MEYIKLCNGNFSETDCKNCLVYIKCKELEMKKTGYALCEECKKQLATHMCSDCGALYCKECLNLYENTCECRMNNIQSLPTDHEK
jgi:hypothetical protein